MLIEVNEECNYVNLIKEENGRRQEIPISINDFVNSIKNSINMGKTESVSSPLYKKIGKCSLIQSKIIDKKSGVYILSVEKQSAFTQLNDFKIDEMGYPHLLFAIKVINCRASRLYVVAVKDDEITEKTKLYQYPFTNVSGEQGNVCLGINTLYNNVFEDNYLFKIPMQFYAMPNTLHSFSPANNKYGMDCKELMLSLKDKEFNDELLVEKNINYQQWFDNL